MRNIFVLLFMLYVSCGYAQVIDKRESDFCELTVRLDQIEKPPFVIRVDRHVNSGKITLSGTTPGIYNYHYSDLTDFDAVLMDTEVYEFFNRLDKSGIWKKENIRMNETRDLQQRTYQYNLRCYKEGVFYMIKADESKVLTPLLQVVHAMQSLAVSKFREKEKAGISGETRYEDRIAKALQKEGLKEFCKKETDAEVNFIYACNMKIVLAMKFSWEKTGGTLYYKNKLDEDPLTPAYFSYIAKQDFAAAQKTVRKTLDKHRKDISKSPQIVFQPVCEMRLQIKEDDSCEQYYEIDRYPYQKVQGEPSKLNMFWNDLGELVYDVFQKNKNDSMKLKKVK